LQLAAGEVKHVQAEVGRLERILKGKEEERNMVVSLLRRQMIGEKTLARQLHEIAAEEAAVREQLDTLRNKVHDAQAQDTFLHSTQALLGELNGKLDGPLTWELKRQLVEILVK
jgi:septal ring factor EnvC (AmiA/AmiB activator)